MKSVGLDHAGLINIIHPCVNKNPKSSITWAWSGNTSSHASLHYPIPYTQRPIPYTLFPQSPGPGPETRHHTPPCITLYPIPYTLNHLGLVRKHVGIRLFAPLELLPRPNLLNLSDKRRPSTLLASALGVLDVERNLPDKGLGFRV